MRPPATDEQRREMTIGCLDFGGTSLKVGILDVRGVGPIASRPLEGAPADLDAGLDALAALRTAGAPAPTALAVAVPGLLTADGRRLREAHGKYGWMLDADLVGELERRAGLPTLLENDARAALIGECASGVAEGETDVVAIVLGTGIGTAAMVQGATLRGADGSAGILGGHLTIDRSGPDCVCGNVGCAEAFGGTWALPGRLAAAGSSDTAVDGFEGLLRRVDAGDAAATVVFDGAVDAWAITAVSLCHSYDPRVLVLAGGVSRAAPRFAGRIERHLDRRLWSSVPRPRVVVSDSPDTSVLRGLARLGEERGSR